MNAKMRRPAERLVKNIAMPEGCRDNRAVKLNRIGRNNFPSEERFVMTI
jgi:hypothetical protein